MITNLKKFLTKFFLILLFLFLGLFLVVVNAMAYSQYFSIWEGHYSSSSTLGANCQICHSENFETLNAYGRDICLVDDDDFENRLLAVQDFDSDGDGNSNNIEIVAGAQPGWTEGDNRLYHSDTCEDALVNITVPSSIPDPYDPEYTFFIFVPFIIRSNE